MNYWQLIIYIMGISTISTCSQKQADKVLPAQQVENTTAAMPDLNKDDSLQHAQLTADTILSPVPNTNITNAFSLKTGMASLFSTASTKNRSIKSETDYSKDIIAANNYYDFMGYPFADKPSPIWMPDQYFQPYDLIYTKGQPKWETTLCNNIESIILDDGVTATLQYCALTTPYYIPMVNLLTYSEDSSFIAGLNLFHSINLQYGFLQTKLKSFANGYSNKYYQINSDLEIAILYADVIYEGEGEQYEFIATENWRLDRNGLITRYYPDDGQVSSKMEKGMVRNHKREGLWQEYKPNAVLETLALSEATYNAGIIQGKRAFYSSNQNLDDNRTVLSNWTKAKGPLLYTETYDQGRLIKRTFTDAINE